MSVGVLLCGFCGFSIFFGARTVFSMDACQLFSACVGRYDAAAGARVWSSQRRWLLTRAPRTLSGSGLTATPGVWDRGSGQLKTAPEAQGQQRAGGLRTALLFRCLRAPAGKGCSDGFRPSPRSGAWPPRLPRLPSLRCRRFQPLQPVSPQPTPSPLSGSDL